LDAENGRPPNLAGSPASVPPGTSMQADPAGMDSVGRIRSDLNPMRSAGSGDPRIASPRFPATRTL